MNPPVVVLGATGQVGLFAISRLLDAGRKVIAVTRTTTSVSETTVAGLQRVDRAGLFSLLRDYKNESGNNLALLSCGPVKLALDLLRSDEVISPELWERVVVIGTTSVLTKKHSRDEFERSLIAEIETSCAGIREACEIGKIPLTLLSPTLIYGCGMDQNLSRVYSWIRRFGFSPVAWAATGQRQPLHVADLARTIFYALQASPASSIESPVCGRGSVSYQEMTALIFDAADRSRRLMRLPGVLVPLVVGLSRLLPGMGRLNSEMFRRQSQDLVFDDSAARNQLGHNPRAFCPTAEDFRLPPEIDRICQALS